MGDGKARKIIFIDKKFQGEFILKFLLLLLVRPQGLFPKTAG
ncbi:MAG: hypothetical protein WCQ48_08170 [Chloroflexota bacterium]